MATGSRDAKLTLSVEALGQENIAALEKDLRALAATGEAGATEFAQFADRVAELGQQAQALNVVKQLATATAELGQQQQVAGESVAKLKANLASLTATTDAAKAAEAKLKLEVSANAAAMQNSVAAQRLVNAERKSGTKTKEEYGVALEKEVRAQNELAASALDLKRKHEDAKQATKAAGDAQKAATAETERAVTAYNLTTKALEDQEKALRMASEDAAKLGTDVRNLATAEAALQSALTSTVASARSHKAATDEMAESERLYEIEKKATLELYARGAVALHAEVTAMREAARATEQYAAQKAEMDAKAATWEKEARDIVEAAQAALKASQSADLYVAKLRELEKVNAWGKQAQQAEQLVRVRDYVRAWATELDGANAKLKSVNAAFATLNVRPMRDIQTEINAVNAALRTVTASGQMTGRELATASQKAKVQIAALSREARELSGSLTMADKASSLLKNSMGQIAVGNLVADGIAYLVQRVKDMGREFIQANLDFERLQRTMVQITGSTEAAAQKIEFLRSVANTAGVAVSSVTDSFIKFQASASASGMAAEEVDAIFQSVTVAGSRMGMSSERVSLALDALGQIAGKSVVSMEELRQQLGDSLPGAVAIAAKGLNITTSALTKLVESGQLSAKEFFPAFRRGINETFGNADSVVEGLSQSFSRLGNQFTVLYQKAAGSTAFKVLGASVDALTANFDAAVTVIGGLAKALVTLKLIEYVRSFSTLGQAAKTAAVDVATQTTATTANTAATVANTEAKTLNAAATRSQGLASTAAAAAATAGIGAFKLAAGAMGTMVTAARTLGAALGGLPGLLAILVLNYKEIGVGIGEWVASMTSAGTALRAHERQIQALEAAEKAAAVARADAAAKATSGLQNEITALGKSTLALKGKEEAAKKATEAESQRNVVLQRTTDLLGVQKLSLDTAVVAAQNNAKAAQNESTVRTALVTALELEIAKRTELINATGGANEKAKDELEKLQTLLGVKKEEAAQSEASAQLARLEIAERQIAAATYKDNADKVGEFSTALVDAQRVLGEVTAMEQKGLPVKEALAAAEIEVAKATRLHADAISDYAIKAEARTKLDNAQANLTLTKVNTEKQNYEAMAASARASGDYAMATYYSIEAKRAEIRAVEITMAAKRREAIQEEETATLQLAELERTDKFNEVKRLELQTRIANAKAKNAETAEGEALIKNLEREIEQLNNLANRQKQNTRNMGDNISERERSIAAREREYALMEREMALAEKMREGSATMHNDLGTRTGIVNFLKSAGVTDEATARRIASEFADANGNVIYSNNPGQLKYGGRNSTLSEAVMRAAETVTFGSGGGGLGGGKSSDSSGSSTTGSTPNSTRTVTVNLGGRTHTIGTASQGDSNALVGMLRSLETNVNTSV